MVRYVSVSIERRDILKREYISRTSGMRNSRRKPPVSRRRRRVPIPAIVIILIIAIVAAILIFVNPAGNQDGKDTASSPTTSATSAASSAISDPSQAGVVSGSSDIDDAPASASVQLKLDDLTPAAERDISSLEKDYFNTMFIIGGSGYRYFSFSESQSVSFIETVADFAASTPANVYTMVVPSSTDIMLSQSFLADVETSDQQKAIDYLNASIKHAAERVNTLDLYDILKANCDKDIYFQTDRNWTQLGAYLGYYEFMRAGGKAAKPLSDFIEVTAEGFRGRFYSQSQENSALEHVEKIVSYKPQYSTTMSIPGTEEDKPIVDDATLYDIADKYSIFIGGDNAYTSIVNNELTDGSTIIVVKDSMGNALIPFLTASYQTVIAVDYRYSEDSIRELVEQKSAADVLIMPQISLTSDADLLPGFSALLA